jgi:tetratricopeptide (TPR) repeat protein
MGIFLTLMILAVVIVIPSAVSIPAEAKSNRQQAVSANNHGVDLYNAQKYKEAITEYERAIQLDPKYTEAYSNRGAAYDAIDNPERAVEDYSMAIKLNPHLSAALSNRAAAYCDLGQFDNAVADLNLVIRQSPRDARAYNKRGSAYQSLGDLDAARKDFEKAISLDKHYWAAQQNLVLVKRSIQAGAGAGSTPGTAGGDILIGSPAAGSNQATGGQSGSPAVGSNQATSGPSGSPTVGSNHATSPIVSLVPNGSTTAPTPSPIGTAPSSIGTAPSPTAPVPSPTAPAPSPIAPTPSPTASTSTTNNVLDNFLYHVLGTFCYATRQYTAAAANFGKAAQANSRDAFAYYRRGNSYLALGQAQLAINDYDRALVLSPHFKVAYLKREAARKLASTAPGRSQ